jgi:hypothetical protein
MSSYRLMALIQIEKGLTAFAFVPNSTINFSFELGHDLVLGHAKKELIDCPDIFNRNRILLTTIWGPRHSFTFKTLSFVLLDSKIGLVKILLY